MKILNIHGYHGNSCNSAYTVLEELGHNIVSPQLDYDASPMNEIFDKLSGSVVKESVDCIVGTSFGGFFAAALCEKHNIKTVLVNPCIVPYFDLPRLGYEIDLEAATKLFGAIPQVDKSLVHVILGEKDEVIGHQEFTKQIFLSENIMLVPEGKHSGATLPLDEFFKDCIGEIYAI